MPSHTEAQVRSAVVPSHVEKTSTYQPVSHGDAIDLMECALNSRGYEILRDPAGKDLRQFTLDKAREKMVGTMPLTLNVDPSVRMMVGIMNSYDKSMALRVGFGSQVMVCTNGCFFASQVVRAKHIPGVISTIQDKMSEALNVLDDICRQQRDLFDRLRNTDLSDREAYHFTGRMIREAKVVPDGDMIKILDEWHEPSYDDFKPRTAWSLHNAVTEVSKKTAQRNGVTFHDRTQRLSGFFATEFASDLKLSAVDPSMNAALLN